MAAVVIEEFLHRGWLANSPVQIRQCALLLMEQPSLTGRLQGMLADGLPVTVMWGELDDAWPTAVKMRMAADLGAPDIEIPGAGHSPNADQPELLVEYLMRARHL